MIIKFRPSSHSSDWTVMITSKTPRQARQIEDALNRLLSDMRESPERYETDWSPGEAELARDGKKVVFSVNTAGSVKEVKATINRFKTRKTQWYQDYQKLQIALKLSEKHTLATAILMLSPLEVTMITWLNNNCGKPKTVKEDGEEWQVWKYKGSLIYNSDGKMLYVADDPSDRALDLAVATNWKVTRLP